MESDNRRMNNVFGEAIKRMFSKSKSLISITLLFAFVGLLSAGCGGKNSMALPRTYGSSATANPADPTASSDQKDDAAAKSETNPETATPKIDKPVAHAETRSKPPVESKPVIDSSILKAIPSEPLLFYGGNDVGDSAAAVDDDIWRQFDLADEYHAMGVIANREAGWEEAQYYFEKSLKILAALDIESDTSLTPEAAKYTQLLDNVISDYRVTLRSLGRLEVDVSTSVLIERFGDVAGKLQSDTMQIFSTERPKTITYDLPVVMNDRVKKSIVYFQTVAKDAFTKYLRRSQKYKPLMLKTIREYGLPEDLIYLSLIESGYNPKAYSWARASGLWQFISSTGRMYQLNRNWWIDERRDPVKATDAACRFLKDLYDKFGHWELAMAAYNGGPGRVSRTIKKQKTRDFWKLRLKRQTMDYVPFIYAAAIIAKDPAKYGFTDYEMEPELVWETVTINKCLELKVISKTVGCTVAELQNLNPELLRRYTPPDRKNYKLKLPPGSTAKFLAAYDAMPSPKETSWVRHKIRRGEAISTIASRYGVSQYAILEANNLSRRSTIYAGKTIIVPVPLDREYKTGQNRKKNQDYKANKSIYVVRSGDTMWDIARAFGTTVSSLRRNNYIERGSRIYVGQKIKIPSTAKKLKDKNNFDSSHRYASNGKTKSIKKASQTRLATIGSAEKKSYTVRSGDSLWEIARRYGLTTAQLRRLNSLGRSSRIYPGQKLIVTGTGAEYVTHKVRRGETLGKIARKYGTSIARIVVTNNISDPNELAVGTRLKIKLK